MDTTIQNVLAEYYPQIIHIFYGQKRIWYDLASLTVVVLAMCKDLGCRLIEAWVRDVEKTFEDSPERRQAGLHVKHRRIKTIDTELGTLRLSNLIFRDRKTGQCMSPILMYLGITPHQRITDSLGRALVEAAAFMPYQLAAKFVSGGLVTKETVRNWISRMISPELFHDGVKRCVKVLHIFLDEAHLAFQKDKKKQKHGIFPVGVVAEGARAVCNGRNELTNVMRFVSEDLTAKTLLKAIEGYVLSRYDLTDLKIYIHGDSAAWIVKAFEEWGNIYRVMDGFHFERDIRRFARRAGHHQFEDIKEGYKTVLRSLRKLIRKNDRATCVELATTLAENEKDASRRKKMQNFASFLNDHWDRIVARQEKGLLGSCTEGCVQHLLASRFTTLPMSWSKTGAAKLGAIRLYLLNGGSLVEPDPLRRPQGHYAELVDQILADWKDGSSLSFDIFEPAGESLDTSSATRKLPGLIKKGGQRTA